MIPDVAPNRRHRSRAKLSNAFDFDKSVGLLAKSLYPLIKTALAAQVVAGADKEERIFGADRSTDSMGRMGSRNQAVLL